jgi:hypothetical protein
VNRPSELAITIATLERGTNHFSGWVYADQVRHGLSLLGVQCSTQQAAAWLARMAAAECPWVERKREYDIWLYRVTQYGRNDIENKLPMLQVRT